jgi:hypothetical protein
VTEVEEPLPEDTYMCSFSIMETVTTVFIHPRILSNVTEVEEPLPEDTYMCSFSIMETVTTAFIHPRDHLKCDRGLRTSARDSKSRP